MPDPDVLMVKGAIADNEERMREIEHQTLNAVQAVRSHLALYDTPGDVDIESIRAAVADLDILVQGYRTLRDLNAQLKERLG